MADLDQLLTRIQATLDTCDATTLPPLDSEPVDEQALAELLTAHEQSPYWDRPILAAEREHQALVEASPKHRSWLVRWLVRRAQL